jgi:NET1-associated nuclear protein 1 (U3 small nucleolar RNA-associated protein 17)
MEAGQQIIGFGLCPENQEYLYIFTSSGSISKWNWSSGKRIARWETTCTTISMSLALVGDEGSAAAISFSIVSQKDGKRQISINALGDKKIQGTTALETSQKINSIKVTHDGRVIIASDGKHLFMGTTTGAELENLETVQYVWREATLPVNATCFDIQTQGSESIDLAVGASVGSILIYQNVLNTLFGKDLSDKKSSPRKLHWHRGSVNTVRWSKDGMSTCIHMFPRERGCSHFIRKLRYLGWPGVRHGPLAVGHGPETIPSPSFIPYLQHRRLRQWQLICG